MRSMKVAAMALVTALAVGGNIIAASEQEAGDDVKACELLQQRAQEAKALPTSAQRVVEAINGFGFDTHQALAPNRREGLTTSPFSLLSAFGLAAEGAKGQTLAEMAKALHLGRDAQATLLTGYPLVAKGLVPTSKDNTLSYANALFADKQFKLKSTYTSAVKKAFGAGVRNLDFRDPSSLTTINEFIKDETKRKIEEDLVKSLDGVPAILLNAGYFKGAWQFKFNVDNTDEDAVFTLADGKETKKPLMYHRGKSFPYYQGQGFQMVSLAFKEGDFAMDVIVPDIQANETPGEALERVQKNLTAKNYAAWLQAEQPAVKLETVALPRFEADFNESIRGPLSERMPLAFSNAADFSDLSKQGVYIGDVIHATKLKVNEEGAEGAFATVIITRQIITSVEPKAPSVIADHPFIALIRNPRTNAVVFASTQLDPKPLA